MSAFIGGENRVREEMLPAPTNDRIQRTVKALDLCNMLMSQMTKENITFHNAELGKDMAFVHLEVAELVDEWHSLN